MHITIIAGARPNFMKISPIIKAITRKRDNGENINYSLVHTGQHFDKVMSETFFTELNIPNPDINLACGGGTQAEQTAAIMLAFERYIQQNPTDLVLVVGDVTSTMACTIVAKKMQIKVAHVEAGIRSRDMTMPEEINRMLTDSIADYFFTTTISANENLLKEGHKKEQLFLVGNVMVDTLLYNMEKLKKPSFFDAKLQPQKYLVLTLHRPSNVDNALKLQSILQEITKNIGNYKMVFPIHPRTKQVLRETEFSAENVLIVEPMGYLEFNFLVKHAKAVITDSGGITEETTVMGIPCMTLRDNTERPETCTVGTNELIGANPDKIKFYLDKLFADEWKKGEIPELWDGKSAERIIAYLCEEFNIV